MTEKLEKFKRLRNLQSAVRKKVLDERYHEVISYAADDEERRRTIYEDPKAWKSLR